MKIFVYALCEPVPFDGQVRYVGISKNPKSRLSDHCKDRERNHRTNWVQGLRKSGHKPVLKILDEVPEEDWEFFERAYIKVYREAGFPLVNGTDGGDRGPDCTGKKQNLSEEQRQKKRERMQGARNHFFGKTHSPEQRARWKVLRKGKSFRVRKDPEEKRRERKDRQKKYAEANREKLQAYQKEYRRLHREKKVAYLRAYRLKLKEFVGGKNNG